MITTWSVGHADNGMSEKILVEQARLVRRHPWWWARAKLALALLDQLGVPPQARVLDAGCGWGVTFEALERRGYRVVGLDVSRRILEQLDRPDRELVEADLTYDLPKDADTFDAVLALDVVEHLDDDRAAIARLAQLVHHGGWLVLSVPALPELFSEFDQIQGHRRRYQPQTLRAAFEGSGLADLDIFWWGAWLVPQLRRQRKTIRTIAGETASQTYRRYLALPPWPLPLVLRLGFAMEQGRAIGRKLRTGTSLFALARRPA
jgi:2-polyprenyl-3-methyl-5-hydroxy-6-metoxy-1,4-benzoquinol methylase